MAGGEGWEMRSTRARTAGGLTLALAAVICAALAAAGGALAATRSLPRKQGTGPRPGPAALYGPLVKAPQLENAPLSGWRAKPILISGASAYRKGEFLYQDYLFDDHGANGNERDQNDPTS